MDSPSQTPQSGRIRSFFIKDILEHKRGPEANQSPPRGTGVTGMVEQESHSRNLSGSYTIQRILTRKEPQRDPDPCISECCDCSSVYPYKTITTPYYHPYLYTLYRQQTAWRNSLKDGVAYTDPQTVLYSQQKQRKPRRPWTRAVFSNLQRKGLEKRFQAQKYLTKGDRHQLASMLGLSDNQVKVWFQNRRMKWRQEEQGQEEPSSDKQSDFKTTVVTTSPNNSLKK